MNPERSKASDSAGPAQTDNLGLIRGVTPEFEQRLLAKGVSTFRQIGRMTPQELAGYLRFVRGVSAKIIAEQDWIGQAREFAGQPPRPRPAQEPGAPSSGSVQLVNQGFVVDLFLDSTGEVHQTQVLHVKSNEGDAWYGWDERKLLDFLMEKAGVKAPVAEPAPAPPVALPVPGALSGNVRLRAAEVVGQPAGGLPCGAGFAVKLRFEFDEPLRSAKGLGYEAVVRATRKPDGVKLILAEATGRLSASDDAITVAIPSGRLDAGIYSLRADLAVTRASGPGEGPLRRESSIPAGMFRVV